MSVILPEHCRVTEYFFCLLPAGHSATSNLRIIVAQCGDNGPDATWAIRNRLAQVYTHRGAWIWEPQPSSRTPSFFKRTRWELQEALDKAEELLPTLRVMGMTAEEVIAGGWS